MKKSDLSADQKEAIGMLLEDHRKVEKLFKDFEQAKSAGEKAGIAREVCTELKLHTRIEEEIFYPSVRNMDAENYGELLNEAAVEHAGAKSLISQLEGMSPEDEMFDAKVTVLREYVKHHVGEEEEQLFPKLAHDKVDMRALGRQMGERKRQLMAELKAA